MSDQDDYSDAPASNPPPESNPMDALAARFEQRLGQISGAVESLAKTQRDMRVSDAESRIRTQSSQIDAATRTADAALGAAERALAAAIESGEATEIARAHRTIAEKVVERDRARARKVDFDRGVREAQRRAAAKPPAETVAQPSGDKADDTNLRNWKSKHSSWYGVDTDLTKAAHDVDRRIREAGVIPVGSQEYFRAIDMQMAQRFPDRFNRSPENSGNSGQARDGNRQSPASGRIPQSVADGWERMGINVRDPEVVKRMLGHREKLVDKGILQPEFTRERVRA